MSPTNGWQADSTHPGFEFRDVGRPAVREYRRTGTCDQRGHCWHTADGTQYQPGPTDTDVHCCYCNATATLPMRVRVAEPQRPIRDAAPDRHGSFRGAA